MVAGAGSASTSAEPGEVVDTEAEEAVTSRTPGRLAARRRIVKSLFRIRSWQRIWGVLGGVLRGYPTELRDRVRDTL